MQLTKGAIGNLINRYKAVLKKCHLMNTFGSLAVAGMLVMGGAGMAVAADPDKALEGKNNYDQTTVNNLMGGWLVKSAETTAADDITLEVKGGTISEIIGGSYVQANSAFDNTLTHGNISTTISGSTTSSQFVVGGSKIANSEKANLKTGDISLTITGGTFGQKDSGKNTDYELVMGGNYLKADLNADDTSKAEAGNITVNISGGEFKTSVTGGSVAHVYGTGANAPALSVTDASTSVTITGGTFGQSYSTGLGAINLDPSIIGGGLALVKGEKGTATSTITGNTLVTINGEKVDINDKVLGGSLAQGKGATVTIGKEGGTSTSAVVVENVKSVGDLVGGNMTEGDATMEAKDVTTTLHGNSSVTVKAGKVEGDIMGGSYARGAGTVTTTGNTSVVFNAANFPTVSQAEYIVGGDKVLGNGTATGEIKGTSSVTINNDASVTTGAVVGGSFSRATPGTAEATVANSVVTINGGKSIAGVVGGGLAEHLTGTGSAKSVVEGTSSVVIKDGTVTNIVYTKGSGEKASSYAAVAGAGLATGANATASVENSVVVIDGAETVIKGNKPDSGKDGYFDKDNAKVVAGGVAVDGGTVNVTNTSLTMKNGTVTGDLVGGNLIDGAGKAGNITSTSVALTGGTLDGEVMGGSYVRGSNTSNIDTTNVLVSGGTLKSVGHKAQYVLGGGKALVYADGQEASLTIDTTNVTISDSVKVLGGGVIGGSLAKGTKTGKATVNVTKANTTILGGTKIAGVVGGGVAENYGAATGDVSSSVTESQLTISGGTIEALRYGAQISDDGETASKAAVVGGGVASAKGTGTITSSVNTANTTINGGTINGNVFAGGMADGTSATANVTNANLTISGNADIQDNIHAGGYALNDGTATVTDTATVTFDGNSSFAGKVFGQGHDATSSNKATVNNSTLAFTNYTGEFNGQVVGFTKLDVAEGSTLKLQTLSTGTTAGKEAGVFNNKALTLAGAGNVEAEAVNVVADKGLSVKNGTLTVTNSLKSAEDGNGTKGINVSDNGVLRAANNLLVKNEGNISIADGLNKLYLGNGGTLAVTGLDSISTADMQDYHSALVATNSTGLIKYEGTAIEISDADKTDFGNLKGSAAEATGALLTGTTVEYGGASYTSTTTINGNYGAETVLISNAANGHHTVELKGDLTLLGDGENLITVKGEDTPTLFQVNVADNKALNLGSAAASSRGGNLGTAHIILRDGSSLNAVAGEYTVGAVDGYGVVSSSAGGRLVAEAIGETSKVATVNASQGSIHSKSNIHTDTLTIKGGMVSSDLGIQVTNLVQDMNGTLTANDDIFLEGGATNAQGRIKTGADLILEGDITKAADGTLDIIVDKNIKASGRAIEATNLQAKKMEAKDVSVEGGSLLLTDASTVDSLKLTKAGISVADLTVSNGVIMTNGSAGMIDKLKTNGNFTIGEAGSDGVSLVVKEMTTTAGTGALTFDPDWGYASNNAAIEKLNYNAITDSNAVNNALQVGRNSYVALGTTDKGWLPSVVQGGLREDGVETVLGLAKPLVVQSTGSIELNSDAGYVAGSGWASATNTATFGANSLLVVNGAKIYGDKAAISFETTGDLKVDAGAKLLVTDAVAGQTYTIVGNVNDPTTSLAGWKNNGMTSTTDMISLGDAVFDGTDKVTTSAVRNDAHTVFPNLSDGMANAVNDLYTGHAGAAGQPNWDYADVDSDQMGVRFLSRATDNTYLGADKKAAAESIESAARIAFAGAAPQMTKMASDAATNAVVNRLGFANPVDGAQAINSEGKIVDRNTTGFALWIAPLWQSQHGWGLDAGNMDYGFNGNLGGVSLGADYTFENAIRAGITFNIGGGYAESSGGDLSSTENRMNFWGLGAYAGWNYENFGVMADVSYTSTWNQLKQDLDSRLGMGNKLEADVQASAISAGLRAEYLLQTSAMDIIPHIGVRYMSLNTWGYDVDTHGGTMLEGDSLHQDIWTFPIGVTFSKDFALDSGWNFKPSLDFSVIPAAGDIKAKHDVHFTGLPGTYEVETQMMDYLTWQGGVGLELANDNMSIGVNYTLQAGQHTTGHGVFGSFRYEF
ncbi:hypothetical protein [Desulfovibrio piger]